MQAILGAGGAIGTELAKALPSYTHRIRLVGRTPKKVNPSDELFVADLVHADEVMKAVEGVEVVYLTVGLPYHTKIWEQTWPKIMQNVIAACQAHQAKLVFFDNIYMYDGATLNPITEEHPIDPPSKKGAVRAQIQQMLWEAVERGEIDALIARAADFYGPSIKQVSILTETVINPLSQGKKANWLGSPKYKHSFTYAPDAGKATALLGNSPEAYGEAWHLPTAPNPPTGEQWIQSFAKEFKVKPSFQAAPKWMVGVMGVFSPVMKEMKEMLYQYDRDYVFSSHKFEQKFGMHPTPYSEGIKAIMEQDFAEKLR